MADLRDTPINLGGPVTSPTGQLADAQTIVLKTRFQGLGVFPSNMNNLENLADFVAHNNAALPNSLARLATDITVSVDETPGVNSANVSFSAVDSEKPVSLTFSTTAPYVNDEITDSATGITMDRTVGQDPAQIDALGGVANRAKLQISRGAQTNWRRIYTWTMQLASVGAGGNRPFFGLERRAASGSEHNVLYMSRVAGSQTDLVLNTRVQNPANPAQQSFYTLPIGARDTGTQPFHFKVGDIVRFVVEFEKPNPTDTDANQNLRMIITAHRINNNGQIIETLQYNDFSIVPNNDPNTTARGRILGKVNFFSYDEWFLYPSDAGLNYIMPMIGVETFQWIDTLSPRDFLHHSELASRSRPPVTDDYRLLGYYTDMMTDLFTLHSPIDFEKKAVFSDDTDQRPEIGSSPIVRFSDISGAGVAVDAAKHEVVIAGGGGSSSAGISELFQGNVEVTNQARPLILNTGAVIPADADATDEFHFYMRGPDNLVIEFGSITKSNFDAAQTLANRTNNGANRNRNFLNEKVGEITYYLMKAANNVVDFIMHPDAGNTDSVTGTYVLTIHQLSAAAAARIGNVSVTDLHLGVRDIESDANNGGIVTGADRFNPNTGDEAIRFETSTTGTSIPAGVTVNETNGEIVFAPGVWILCLSARFRNHAANASNYQNSRAWMKAQIRYGATARRHENEAYSRWGYPYRADPRIANVSSLQDFHTPTVSVTGVIITDGSTPTTVRV